MVPRQFFYPRVVIEFYHTMTSRREANPTTLHFSIDGRPGILRASDITAALHIPVVLANAADYRQWPHPFPREMVQLLSMDATGGSILFRRHLPQCMLLTDHILRSNMLQLQHIVQRRGAILEVLYRISKGYRFSLAELIMTSLFHFEDRVHRWSLPRAESMPLLFSRLFDEYLKYSFYPYDLVSFSSIFMLNKFPNALKVYTYDQVIDLVELCKIGGKIATEATGEATEF